MSAPFTKHFERRALAIQTDVRISESYDSSRMTKKSHPTYIDAKAIWDTGAVNTVITTALASKLGLKPLGYVQMQHANGYAIVNTYMVNVLLPNKIEVQTLYVMEGDMNDTDVLIGMDIISLCDFAITNNNGKTTFSFDIPSNHITDYSK